MWIFILTWIWGKCLYVAHKSFTPFLMTVILIYWFQQFCGQPCCQYFFEVSKDLPREPIILTWLPKVWSWTEFSCICQVSEGGRTKLEHAHSGVPEFIWSLEGKACFTGQYWCTGTCTFWIFLAQISKDTTRVTGHCYCFLDRIWRIVPFFKTKEKISTSVYSSENIILGNHQSFMYAITSLWSILSIASESILAMFLECEITTANAWRAEFGQGAINRAEY